MHTLFVIGALFTWLFGAGVDPARPDGYLDNIKPVLPLADVRPF